MIRQQLIAYATSFISFLLDEKVSDSIEKILLFGSVARGVQDTESDIDLFIDTKKEIEKDVQKTLATFLHSEIQKKWELKGIHNDISLKIGDLEEWNLKRDILNDAIILYGKYSEHPQKLKHALLIQPKISTAKRKKQVSIWRKLYGYTQKVGGKKYITEGIVTQADGTRVSSGILVPVEKKKELLEYLNKNNIQYTIQELWTEE